MLKRVYIDNFGAFVNFELALGRQQLILGLNGSGKSTLLEVLRAIKKLVTGDAQPDLLFPESSRTRWQTLTQQTFELDVDLGESYRFRLEVDSPGSPALRRIRRELVICGAQTVFEFVEGEVHLFDDRSEQKEPKVKYPFNPFRSALATIQPRSDNTRLMQFKNWIETLYCLQLNPHSMSGQTAREESEPAFDMSNFASWYRHMIQEQAGAASKLQDQLREIIPGFDGLNISSFGPNLRSLEVDLAITLSPLTTIPFTFDELSDGQRILICLYALLNFVVEGHACLFLDEPENYIALAEIQPWLMELRDRIEDRGGQVILISHHPEIIDYLAPEVGLLFERDGPGPVRVRKYKPDESLSPSEQIARGWQ
ncbi:MAG: AAA family ATPase [Bryobacteraceae bacterium]|jgi:energy-coupling factor transporter ATP-binding protein EcfA2